MGGPARRDGNGEDEAQARRPESHVGCGGALPPLQPDSHTALASDVADLSPTDVLERLRNLKAEEDAATACSHCWGECETETRNALEAFAHTASEDDRKDLEQTALEALSSVESTSALDSDGFALLHYASMYGSMESVAALLRHRAQLHSRTRMHETPLQLAAYYRHADVVALLLAHRARADLADWQGRTPLQAAKSSLCGNGLDLGAAQQARCVELLDSKRARDAESSQGSQAESWREQGNSFFKHGQLNEAIAAYSIGLSVLDDAAIYANRAECYLKLGKLAEAKLDARKAVGLAGEAGHKKASWRLARACLGLGELDAAEEAVREALAKFSGDAALLQLRNEVEKARRARLRA